MATTNRLDIARKNSIGIGIGSSVPAQTSVRWLDENVQLKTDVIENDSAMGIVEKVNDSDIAAKWVEGESLAARSPSSRSDSSCSTTTVRSLPVQQSVASIRTPSASTNRQSLLEWPTSARHGSRLRKTPLTTERQNKLTIDTLEITAEEKSSVTYSAAIKATIGTDFTEIPAFITESEFQAKNIVVQEASTAAGLAAAPTKRVFSFKLNSERPSEAESPLCPSRFSSTNHGKRYGWRAPYGQPM